MVRRFEARDQVRQATGSRIARSANPFITKLLAAPLNAWLSPFDYW